MEYVLPIAAIVIAVLGLYLRKRRKKLGLVVTVFGIWLFFGGLVTLAFGSPEKTTFGVDIFAPVSNVSIMGYQPSETMLTGWGVMAALILGAVILRVFFIPKFTDVPGKLQNVIEIIVETVESYSSERTIFLGRAMYGFVFTIGINLIGNAVAELMGFRSPSSDLMFTLALAIFSFIMSNWYGIRVLKIGGRLKSMSNPTPLLLPIRLITDLANPLSMACRLFGNTLSGMIIMNLLYSVLGNFAGGITSVVGLYFNVFNALIQTVIFVTLTLSTINEATTAEAD